MDNSHHPGSALPFWKSKTGIALIMLAVIRVFYVAREHVGHISQKLPYLILLLCPLMHMFGHNHGGHSHQGGADTPKTCTQPHLNLRLQKTGLSLPLRQG